MKHYMLIWFVKSNVLILVLTLFKTLHDLLSDRSSVTLHEPSLPHVCRLPAQDAEGLPNADRSPMMVNTTNLSEPLRGHAFSMGHANRRFSRRHQVYPTAQSLGRKLEVAPEIRSEPWRDSSSSSRARCHSE